MRLTLKDLILLFSRNSKGRVGKYEWTHYQARVIAILPLVCLVHKWVKLTAFFSLPKSYC